MSILDKTKQLCEERNVKIAQLEKHLGFSNGTIARWKNNKPPLDKVIKVAKYFNVSMDYLSELTDEKSKKEDTQKFCIFEAKNLLSLASEGIASYFVGFVIGNLMQINNINLFSLCDYELLIGLRKKTRLE